MKYQSELPTWIDYKNLPSIIPENVVLWSGTKAPPTLGTKVAPTLTGWDGKYTGTVVGYSTEAGWLGIVLLMEDAPEWRKKLGSYNGISCFAGCEGF